MMPIKAIVVACARTRSRRAARPSAEVQVVVGEVATIERSVYSRCETKSRPNLIVISSLSRNLSAAADRSSMTGWMMARNSFCILLAGGFRALRAAEELIGALLRE